MRDERTCVQLLLSTLHSLATGFDEISPADSGYLIGKVAGGLLFCLRDQTIVASSRGIRFDAPFARTPVSTTAFSFDAKRTVLTAITLCFKKMARTRLGRPFAAGEISARKSRLLWYSSLPTNGERAFPRVIIAKLAMLHEVIICELQSRCAFPL